MNLATQYYVKAKECYPWDLPEAIEALEYALSYDDTHAGTHCLAGRYYAEQDKDFPQAFYHFEQALTYDVNHIDTYYYFADALINFRDFDRAKKLLSHAETIRGICLSCVYSRRALIQEMKGNYCKAKKLLEKSIRKSVHNDEISDLKADLKRVEDKLGVNTSEKTKKS